MRGIRLFLMAASVCLVSLHCAATNYSSDFDSAVTAYDNGDYARAFQMFSSLAQKGDAEAQFYLADMFFGGDGVPKNSAEAVKWYLKAANQGHLNAQYNLGVIYTTGLGVPKNLVLGALWFREASEQGDAEAQHNLGVMYFKGEGVPRDSVQSYMWLILAGRNGNPYAEKVRKIVASKMTPEERAKGQKLSQVWKPKIKALKAH
jgi:TPR repeat protein